MWILIIIGIVILVLLVLLAGNNTSLSTTNNSYTQTLTATDIREYYPYMDNKLAMQYRDAIMKGKYSFKVGKGLIEQWNRRKMLKETAVSSTPCTPFDNEYTKLTWWQLQQYNPVMSIDESADYLAEHILDESKWFTVKTSRLSKWESDLTKYKENDKKLSQTTANNNKGISFEKEGDIASAIGIYEENLRIGYPATHSYTRLIKENY